jgi:hypothetical protein
MEIAGIILVIIAFFLIMQRWFWLLVFGLSTLAAIFAVIASVIHFQILAAVGFSVLAAILAGFTMAIADG